jgi:hypothetical protein
MRVFPGDDALFDLGGFLRRIFLFEHYVVKSVRLREIPNLVKVFGLADCARAIIHCLERNIHSFALLAILENT